VTDVALAIRAQMDAQEATSGLSDIADAASSTSDAVQESAEAAAAASESYNDVATSAKGMSGASKAATGAIKGIAGGLDALGFSGAADKLNDVATATSTLGGVSKAFTAVQAALNAVMAANPVFLIVIAVVALVAAVILAYKKSETFRDIVNAAFRSVSKVVAEVVDFIKEHWKLLFVILTGPIGLAILEIAKHWDQIKAGGAAVVDWVRDHFAAVKDLVTAPFSDAREVVSDVWDKVTGIIGGAKNTITSDLGAVRDVVQSIVDVFQDVIDKVDTVIDKIKSIPHPDLGDLNPFGRTAVGSALGGTAGGFAHQPEVHVHLHNEGTTFIGNDMDLARKLEGLLSANHRAIFGPA
jgi:phage-related protein